jgi:hypothetical protein
LNSYLCLFPGYHLIADADTETQAKVRIDSFTVSASSLRLGVKWGVDPAFSSPTDTVKIYNSKGGDKIN